jgi:predicted N-acetyltransferase YhbS
MRAADRLYDRVFGPARLRKASHQFRLDRDPDPALSWVAMADGAVIGSIRYWPIEIGTAHHPALLLGPLAVDPAYMRQGIGSALTHRTLDIARTRGHGLVLLVGDPAYYRRFGFLPATPFGFVMPDETRPHRLQVKALRSHLLGCISGKLHPCDRHIPDRVPAFALATLSRDMARA